MGTMRRARFAIVTGMLLVFVGLGGCLGDDDGGLESNQLSPEQPATHVVDEDGEPVAFAQVTLLGSDGSVLRLMSANATGVLLAHQITDDADTLVIDAPGYEAWRGSASQLPGEVVLSPWRM